MKAFLFSCEHAVCAIPEAQREFFRGFEDVVASVEGWEPGALNLAQGFAMKFRTPLVYGGVTRLLIDLDEEGDARWSRFSLKIPEPSRVKLVERYHKIYLEELKKRIHEDLKRHEAVMHVMVHTDLGLEGGVTLDTVIDSELAKNYAQDWAVELVAAGVNAKHEEKGVISPLSKMLIESFAELPYAQIRLGVCQGYFLNGRPLKWATIKKCMLETLGAI